MWEEFTITEDTANDFENSQYTRLSFIVKHDGHYFCRATNVFHKASHLAEWEIYHYALPAGGHLQVPVHESVEDDFHPLRVALNFLLKVQEAREVDLAS